MASQALSSLVWLTPSASSTAGSRGSAWCARIMAAMAWGGREGCGGALWGGAGRGGEGLHSWLAKETGEGRGGWTGVRQVVWRDGRDIDDCSGKCMCSLYARSNCAAAHNHHSSPHATPPPHLSVVVVLGVHSAQQPPRLRVLGMLPDLLLEEGFHA